MFGLRDNTVLFISDHGFYFGGPGYFGNVPAWLSESWLLMVGGSSLYQELTRGP
jgi:hypothetical protein